MNDPIRPDLPSTADHPAIQPIERRRLFGVRLWLALMFAAIGTLTGASVYLFVSGSSEGAAEDRSVSLAQGRTALLSSDIEDRIRRLDASGNSGDSVNDVVGPVLASSRNESYRAWFFSPKGKLRSRATVNGVDIANVPRTGEALGQALDGSQAVISDLSGDRTVVAFPVFRGGFVGGAVLALADQPPEVTSALQALQRERLTALAIAVLLAGLIGFLVASLITGRVKRLAAAAGELAQGHLDAPIASGGRDEIGDLARALDSMRIALGESFHALSSERDRLSAVFTSLDEAIIVVGSDGDVRFANPAAGPVIEADGRPLSALRPWIRRATQRGMAESDHIPVGDNVYALSARSLPAERSVLVVVRDRTEELRRDQAEREFVSNAAHELRNPIAGMSGAIEVLRSGAKDDPEARDHFLNRLATDVERVSRLTKSLLTLARMEATGEGEADVVSVGLAVDESLATVDVPDGLTLKTEIDRDLVASADPILLRQVLIGLLTNAFKHTTAPGRVELRAIRIDDDVVIEVEDNGAGIPEAERDRVFERFYRGSGSLEREGFGLGLAIAKRMVDVMGGEIRVESEEGRGSTFRVCLPIAAPSPAPVA